jgi:DNA-binding LytR/AlgR family response regulator
MPTALLADDEPHLADFLHHRLQALWPEVEVVAVARNGLEALAGIGEHEPDVAFLDIKMPGMTGIDVARRAGCGTHFVFVTAFDEFAVAAFEQEAVDYVMKPVQDDRLQRAIDRVKKRLAAAEPPSELGGLLDQLAARLPNVRPRLRWLRANKGELTYQIPVEDVRYIAAEDKYTVIYTGEQEYLIRTALAEISADLDPNDFWQIHRGTIINMNHVASTRRDVASRLFVNLKGVTKELPVSRAYVHLFKGS